MTPYRVSVSDLESFRLFKTGDWMELETLLKQLRREEPPNAKMLAGTALHKFLELAGAGEASRAESNGITFLFNLDAEVELPTVRECKATKEYSIQGNVVTLVCVVDSIHGKHVWDHKLTEKFEVEKYADSIQWRANLAIFGADDFTYNVFEGAETREDAKIWEVWGFHPFTVHRYPNMERDVSDLLAEYVHFAEANLWKVAA